jgi:type I restriction enzyme, S subunit
VKFQKYTEKFKMSYELKSVDFFFLDKIPSHWNLKRIKYISSFTLSSVDRNYNKEDFPVKVCHYPEVYKNEFITSNTLFEDGSCTKNQLISFKINKGDILITKDSETADDIGIPALVTEDLENSVCGYHLGIYRVADEVLPEFFFRYLQSEHVRRYFEVLSNGVTRVGLGKPALENLEIPIPPLDEQEKIVNHIREKSRSVDSILQKIETQKQELLRYRHSLISSVVTGRERV